VIHDSRIRLLNDEDAREGTYVLYWMQQSQRSGFNHALVYAAAEANERGLPVVVGFGLTDDYPEANARHYAFMLEGLRDVARELRDRRIRLVVRRGSPDDVALKLARGAALVVCDRGYLRHQREWRECVARKAKCKVVEVESDVVVPVEVASPKEQIGARTLRPRIQRVQDAFLRDFPEERVETSPRSIDIESDVDPYDPEGTLERLRIDRSVPPVKRFRGGSVEGRRRLEAFVRGGIKGYADGRNEPGDWHTSLLSPYLHFGQISPLEVALAARGARHAGSDDRAAFLEELVVRRELSVNFVRYNERYDSYRCLPGWARRTLDEHLDDERPVVYTKKKLETARTHDPYWNAAMREMVHTGFMHNYMRMYWGKKILEWSRTPRTAYRTALYLNNKYFLDGRDPNSFAGVAWCFGLHDRGWTERPIFGKVRYMNDRGLERKFDIDRYVRRVDELVRGETG
jgi:deoxyribodipyrimidine photo-lyase